MTITIAGGGNPSGPTFPLQRSVRLRSSASAYFNRTPASTTNRTTWTYSAWIKRGSVAAGDYVNLLTTQYNTAGTNSSIIRISGSGLEFISYDAAAITVQVLTTQVFRDPSAWYHIVVVVDTTQATASNRVKLYVNGVQVTALTTATYPSLNYNTYINTVSLVNIIGGLWFNSGGGFAISQSYDGYLTEVNFIDGQALTPTSFGAYNSFGVWSPAKYSGSYGTNGFYLNFQDNSAATAAAIGKDSSGNGNNWTPNNISVTAGVTYDSMLDVPTNTSATNANFCVLNPLQAGNAPSNGNLSATTSGTAHRNTLGTFFFPSAKFYYEVSVPSIQRVSAGMATSSLTLTAVVAGQTSFLGFYGDSTASNVYNGSSSLFTQGAVAANDVYQFCVDAATGNAWFGRNNTFYSSAGAATGNPATGVNPTWTGVTLTQYAPEAGVYDAGTTANANFGQRPFTYTPPTGFIALNTYNLPAPTIPNGATQMAATLYTGTGSSLTIANTVNGTNFQPDFVWVKGRSGATDHALYDSVRGTTKQLESNSTGAETTEATGLTAFGSTGFTVGALAQMNTNTATYVGWQWKANGTPAVTNTSGTIPSTISANTTAGFSIVTYTGTGANATVGHGLGIAPKMVIVKQRTALPSAQNWCVYHSSVGNTGGLYLDLTNATTTSTLFWNNTSPTSSVFSISTGNGVNYSSSANYVAYCFSEISGYSKFGSYTGNGSTDGPFVYLGFRPRWILIKRTDAAGNFWNIIDTSRNTYNVSGSVVYPNSNAAEAVFSFLDILSNGIKIRSISSDFNTSSGTYIYAAFAENPFNYSLAR